MTIPAPPPTLRVPVEPPGLPDPVPGRGTKLVDVAAFLAAVAATAATTWWAAGTLRITTVSSPAPATHTTAEQAFLNLHGGDEGSLDLARAACAELPRHFQPVNPGFGVQEAGGALARHHGRPYSEGVRLTLDAVQSGLCTDGSAGR